MSYDATLLGWLDVAPRPQPSSLSTPACHRKTLNYRKQKDYRNASASAASPDVSISLDRSVPAVHGQGRTICSIAHTRTAGPPAPCLAGSSAEAGSWAAVKAWPRPLQLRHPELPAPTRHPIAVPSPSTLQIPYHLRPQAPWPIMARTSHPTSAEAGLPMAGRPPPGSRAPFVMRRW